MSKCKGCGVLLQSIDPEKKGYIPENKNKEKLCLRCFRIRHYHDLKSVPFGNSKETIKKVNRSNGYAFFLVDFFHLSQEVFDTFHQITVPKSLVFNKIDILPRYIKEEKLEKWLREEYHIEDYILFLSGLKKYGFSSLIRKLEQHKMKTGYLLGYTNSGKSTLINTIINENKMTTSILPNTTLDFLKIPYENGYTFIDTPGFSYTDTLEEENLDLLKKITPKTKIKPMTYPLKKGASILIEDFIRIESKEDCVVTFYISNLLKLKRVYEKNLILKDVEQKDFKLEANQDLVIAGLGFLHVTKKTELTVYMKKINFVSVRNSFFERK